MSISQFVCGLPSIPVSNTLCANLPSHILAANDQNYGACHWLMSKSEQANDNGKQGPNNVNQEFFVIVSNCNDLRTK